MNKEKLLTVLILPSMWFLYVLFELFSGNLYDLNTLIFNFILLIPLLFIGFYFYKINLKYRNGISNKKLIIFSTLLIALDQLTKIIIKLYFFDSKFYIIPKTLSFNPIINTSGSWLNVRFKTNISFSILIFINFIALFIFLELYRYFKSKNIKGFYADCCLIFIFAGSFCSLVDKLFYGGSLDFIGVGSLFIADFKDIFINIAIFLFVMACYKNGFFSNNEETTLKEDLNNIKDFLKFILLDLKALIKLK